MSQLKIHISLAGSQGTHFLPTPLGEESLSPTQSESLSQSLSTAPLNVPTSAFRRKSIAPARSARSDSIFSPLQAAPPVAAPLSGSPLSPSIRLDVFSVFRESPTSLLYDRELRAKILSSVKRQDDERPERQPKRRKSWAPGSHKKKPANYQPETHGLPSPDPSPTRSNAASPLKKPHRKSSTISAKRFKPASNYCEGNSESTDEPKKRKEGIKEEKVVFDVDREVFNVDFRDTHWASPVVWKGEHLRLPSDTPFLSLLTAQEIHTCQVLRIFPDQYLDIKQTLITNWKARGPFNKTAAQKMCRIDVNKTGKLFDWFQALGWLTL